MAGGVDHSAPSQCFGLGRNTERILWQVSQVGNLWAFALNLYAELSSTPLQSEGYTGSAGTLNRCLFVIPKTIANRLGWKAYLASATMGRQNSLENTATTCP